MIDDGLKARFLAKFEQRGEDECWEWNSAVAGQGYGFLKRTGERRQIYAHRVAYELAKGPIPEGMLVCHECDNPPCVNPKHLFLGTDGDNHADMKAKDRHLYGERNGNHRLTEAAVERVFDMLDNGVSTYEIAEAVGVAQSTVWLISCGENWHHVWVRRRPQAA